VAKGKVHGKDGTAEMLEINASTLRARMKKMGISFGRSKDDDHDRGTVAPAAEYADEGESKNPYCPLLAGTGAGAIARQSYATLSS